MMSHTNVYYSLFSRYCWPRSPPSSPIHYLHCRGAPSPLMVRPIFIVRQLRYVELPIYLAGFNSSFSQPPLLHPFIALDVLSIFPSLPSFFTPISFPFYLTACPFTPVPSLLYLTSPSPSSSLSSFSSLLLSLRHPFLPSIPSIYSILHWSFDNIH